MATIPMVVAVRRNPQGDVLDVQMGIADTDQNTWAAGGEPKFVPVLEVVDALMRDDRIWSRMPNGTPGPRLKVVAAKAGQGIETVELDHPTLTVADLEQF